MRVAMIGRRDLNASQRMYCQSVGAWYAEQGAVADGVTICSGGAPGADQAFMLGAMCTHDARVFFELYLPWDSFEERSRVGREGIITAAQATPTQQEHARWAHPAWPRVSRSAQQLFIRNAQLVWDAWLVVAHPNMKKRGWGGTGHAIRVARMRGRPVYLCNRSAQRFYIDGEGE